MKTYQIDLFLLLLFGSTYGYKKLQRDLSSCKNPLGMESGEIPNENIVCTRSSTVWGDCTGTCGDSRYNMVKEQSYWCLSEVDTVNGYFTVTFPYMTIVTGFALQSRPCNCGIKQLYLQYGYGDGKFMDYAAGTDLRTVFDTPMDDNLVWLTKAIIVKEVAIRPLAFDNSVLSLFRARFEFYGCSYKDALQPVGLQSGLITDEQIQLFDNENNQNYFNPNAARLNTAMFDGWRASFTNDRSNVVNNEQLWIDVDLGKKWKLVSLNVQQNSNQDTKNAPYFLYYGQSYATVRKYTGTEIMDYAGSPSQYAKLITPISTTIDNKDGIYTFKYPLIAQRVRLFPTINGEYPSIKLEFYGTSPFVPTHEWKFQSNLSDEVMFQDFVVPNEVLLSDNGLFIKSPLSSKIKSLPFGSDDCMINPENCAGLTVSFSAKINEIPKGHLRSYPIPVQPTSCSPQNLNKKFALHISDVKLLYGTTALTASQLILSDMGSITTITAGLFAKVYVGKSDSFVTSCTFNTTSEKELYKALVSIDCKTDKCIISGLDMLLTRALEYFYWVSGTSIVLLFEPTSVTQSMVIPTTTKWTLDVYVNYACKNHSYDVVDAQFSQKGSACASGDFSPSNAKFSSPGIWRDCDGDENFLEINLNFVKVIIMVKVAGLSSGFVDTFSLMYTRDGISWISVFDGDDNNFIFTKHITQSETLYLPVPIEAQYIRVIPLSHKGSYSQMNIDVVVCGAKQVLSMHLENTVLADAHEIKHDDSQIYFIDFDVNAQYVNLDFVYTYDIISDTQVSHVDERRQFYCKNAFEVDHADGVLTCLYINHKVYKLVPGFTFNTLTCHGYALTLEHIFCIEDSTGERNILRYTRSVSTPDIVGTGKKMKQIKASISGDIVYGLGQYSSTVWKLNVGDKSWEQLSNATCTLIQVSVDNMLWCLHDGDIFVWNPLGIGWLVIVSGQNCRYFSVSRSYIVCTLQNYRPMLMRRPTSNPPVERLEKLGDFKNCVDQIFLTETGRSFCYAADNCVWYNSAHYWYNDGGCVGFESCDNAWESKDTFRNCVNSTGFYSSSSSIVLYPMLDTKTFDVSGNGIVFVDSSTRYVYWSQRECCNQVPVLRDSSGDAKEVQYDSTTETLYILKTNGDIFNGKELYMKGPCDSFKISSSGNNMFCSKHKVLFIHKMFVSGGVWIPVLNEKLCDSFDGSDDFLVCYVIGDGVYKKSLSIASDYNYLSEFPIVSSGLQRFKQNSQGKGFQISLSTLHSTLFVSLQTNDGIAEGAFQIDTTSGLDEWNEYMFSWSTVDKQMSLFVNKTLVGSHFVTPSLPSPAIENSNCINIGGFYDSLSIYSQNFELRDLKVWKNNFTLEELSSFEKDTGLAGEVMATFDNGCVAVAINDDTNEWVCASVNGIYTHPVEHEPKMDLWMHHSNKNCSKLEFIYGYLLCLSNDSYIYAWVSNNWIQITDDEVLDFALYSEYGQFMFVQSHEVTTMKFHAYIDCVNGGSGNCVKDYVFRTSEGYRVTYTGEYNYVLEVDDDVNSFPGNKRLDVVPKEMCGKFFVYDENIWCLNPGGYIYRRSGEKWVKEMEQLCNDFRITINYILCANGRLYLKWRNRNDDGLSFETLYTNKEAGYEIKTACSHSPTSTEPCFDLELSQSNVDRLIYFHGPAIEDKVSAKFKCNLHGSNMMSIHSDDEMATIYNMSKVPLQKTIYLGLERKTWDDGTPYVYNKFESSPEPSEDCAYFKNDFSTAEDVHWNFATCTNRYSYVCQTDGYSVSVSLTPVKFYFWNLTNCSVYPYVPGEENILASGNEESRMYTVALINTENLPRDILVRTAQILYTSSASTGVALKFYIGLLHNNYTSCTNDESIQAYLSYVSPVEWSIGIHAEDDILISPDISQLVQHFINTNNDVSALLPIVIFWTPGSIQTLDTVTFKSLSLDVFYNHRDSGNKFLSFSSANLNSKFPPGKYSTMTLPEKIRSFSFWYHMKGANVGTLYVWLDPKNAIIPYPVFVAQGDQGALWKRAIVKIPDNALSVKITFLAFKRNEDFGDIAIDAIETSSWKYDSTFEPVYKMQDESLYLQQMKRAGLPIPVILLSFRLSLVSYAVFNKTVTTTELEGSLMEDKFHFPHHAWNLIRSKDNSILEVVDIQDIVDVVKTEFSILFHVKIMFWNHPVVLLQFGKTELSVLRVIIHNDKLKIMHGTVQVYESSWSFIENTWTYIGIVYQDGEMKVYLNNVVDSRTAVYDLPLPPFLHFFRDPTKPGKDEAFEGSISCFQMYNESLSESQMEALEFCPNRIDPVICPYNCKNGGHCIPLKINCQCPSNLKRYYSSDCGHGLAAYREASIFQMNFDMEYNTSTSNVEPSPMNYARCVRDRTEVLASILGSCLLDLNGCNDGFLLSFWFYIVEYRDIGLTNILQFGNLKIAANFTFQPSNSSFIQGDIQWQSNTFACIGHFLLPIEAWVYFNVWVLPNSMSWTINKNQITGEAVCNSISDTSTYGEVLFTYGNVSKFCIDEVVVFNYSTEIKDSRDVLHDIISKRDYDPVFELNVTAHNPTESKATIRTVMMQYLDSLPSLQSITYTTKELSFLTVNGKRILISNIIINGRMPETMNKDLAGTYSTTVDGDQFDFVRGEEEGPFYQLQPLKSSRNYYSHFEFYITANFPNWTEKLLDRTSEEFFAENRTFVSMLRTQMQHVYAKLYTHYDIGSVYFMESAGGKVSALVTIYFKRFLQQKFASAFQDNDAYKYNGLIYNIQRTNKSSVPYAALEYNITLLNDTTIQIVITNMEHINRQYHQYFYVKAEIRFAHTNDFIDYDRRSFVTGKNILLFTNAVTFRKYKMTVSSFTHEGRTISGEAKEIITPATVNLMPATFISAKPELSTSIHLTWTAYDINDYNSVNLLAYTILYKKTSDIDIANVSSYDRVNVSSTATSYSLTGLEVYTEYRIYLGTWNDIGLGALVVTTQRSNEGVPEVAPNMTSIKLVDITKVRLNWSTIPEDIELYNAPTFLGYQIEIVPLVPSHVSVACQQFLFKLDNQTNTKEHTTHCEPMKTFIVKISARTNEGSGVENVNCYTLGRTTPGRISVLKGSFGPPMPNDKTSENITVGLVPLAEENTVIRFYQIRYKIIEWPDDWKVFNVSINHTKEDLNHWEIQREGFFECPHKLWNESTVPIKASSKVVEYQLYPLVYYTNYSMEGKACSDEGCSQLNMSYTFRTAEHAPFCPPNNITMFNTSSTSLVVTFDRITHFCLAGELLFYGIILLETEKYETTILNGSSIEEMKQHGLFNTTLKTEIEFFDLHEYWRYTVLVYAENNGGMGNISFPVEALTDEDIPNGAPLNCFVVHNSSSEFTLHIGKPERYLINGEIKYEVNITNTYGDEINRTVQVTGDDTSTVFSNMTKFMYHNISIRAVTRVGAGPVVMLYIRTLEDVPSLPPVNIQISNITNDSLILSWDDVPPRSLHGVLVNFYVVGHGILANKTKQDFEVYTMEYQYVFHSMFPATHYTFWVSACTRIGCAAEDFIGERTREMVPSGVVNNVTSSNFTSNSFHVSWSPIYPMERRGVIIYKNISLVNILHPDWQTEDDIITLFYYSNTSSVIVDGLDNDTSYKVSITAYTEIGCGPFTKEIIYRTNENVPSAAPENVTAFDTSSSSLNVSWLLLPPSDHEGDLVGYYIKYDVQHGFTDLRNGPATGYFLCVGKEKTSCIVEGLSLNTPYDIHVAGYTKIGNGPMSETINATTGEFTDGNWTSWTNWGACSRSCGKGFELKQRWCVNPEPEAGGNQCKGNRIATRPCNNQTCPGFYLGKEGESCTKTCLSLGSNFDCATYMDIHNSTEFFLDAIDHYNYTQFVNISCNTVSDMSPYSDSTDPSYDTDTALCKGFAALPEKISCSAQPLMTQRRLCRCLDKESAQYRDWANWGLCTKTCGTGTYQRYRECILENGCTGSDVDKQDCNTNPCAIHGQWGEWTLFANCTVPCGFGERIRQRFCNNPEPKFNGKDCEGVDSESIAGCNPYPCPQHGNWGPWGPLQECKHSCGTDGEQEIRTRKCDNPAPLHDGDYCEGHSMEAYVCNENKACAPARYYFTVRFTDEVWKLPMYQLHDENSVNLSRRIDEAIHTFYTSSQLANSTADLEIEFHRMKKGSVIVYFSIEYPAVPHAEELIFQHAIENGFIDTMPVGMEGVTVNTLPSISPPAVIAESNTPFSINVMWTPLNSSVMNGVFNVYQVFYKKLQDTTWDNFATNHSGYELTDLNPATEYVIHVLAATDSGNGVASPQLRIFTIEGAPLIKPPSCTHQILDSRTVYFAWSPIPQTEVPGILRGYKIKFRKYFEDNYQYAAADETMTQKTVSMFRPFTWYWIEVAAFTNAGSGPYHLFVIQTPPGAPEIAPPNATAHDRQSTTQILVTWDFMSRVDENGYLVGYKLYYRPVQQSGVDLPPGEPFVSVNMDRFTKEYLMINLSSYTQYEITLYAYSAFGDGPSIVIYGDTCRCPEYIFNSWYESKPYIEQVGRTTDVTRGLFPDLLSMVVNAICFDCKAYRPSMYYNKTKDGRTAKKENVEEVKKYLDDNIHFSYPIFGRFTLTRFAGNPFVGIVNSQGSALLVYQPDYKTVGFINILLAVYLAWPVILIAVLLAVMAGWVAWFLEQRADSCDITQDKSLYGAYESFWMAFITMTTLGYGDYVPAAIPTKVFMLLWILIGLCLVSIFGAAVSTNMNVSSMNKDYKLYGTEVAAITDSFEYRIAILRNAIVGENGTRNYTTVNDVIDAVSSGVVEVGLIDAFATKGYEDTLKSKNVKIYRILDLQSGYGVVLSGEFVRLETDMRSYVISNQAKISLFVQDKIGILQPAILEIEELLLTPEESNAVLLNLTIAYFVMAFVGCFVWYIFIYRRSFRKVAPKDEMTSRQDDLSRTSEVFEEFKVRFQETVATLDQKHVKERVELNDLKRSYEIHVKRGDVPKMVEKSQRKRRKRCVQKHSEVAHAHGELYK